MADGTPAGPTCVDCDAVLTEVEAHYYEYRCEACEQKWLAYVSAECGRCGFGHHIDPTTKHCPDHVDEQ